MGASEAGIIRWGLIGAGDIAEKRVAPAIRDTPRSSLHAVARRREELAEAFARRFEAKRWFTTWTELLRDAEIDAVYIATPVNLHAEIAVAAAETGKHVLCEKPMAMSIAECDRMIAAADANGTLLGVAYYRHFYPVVKRLKELLESGTIGRPVIAQINAFERFDPPPDHPRAWLLDPRSSGGGPMFDFGCHRLEILQHLLGSMEGASGMIANAVFDRAVEDTAVAVVRAEGGSIGTVAVTHGAAEPRDSLDIYCEHGTAHVPVLNQGTLFLTHRGERLEEHHPPHQNLHQPLVAQFVGAVLEGGRPAVDGVAGREVNRMLEAVYPTFGDSPRIAG